jgi:hypothetical protein
MSRGLDMELNFKRNPESLYKRRRTYAELITDSFQSLRLRDVSIVCFVGKSRLLTACRVGCDSDLWFSIRGSWAGRPGDWGLILGRGKGFFHCGLCPDRLWGPPSLLYNGYRESFPRE